MSKKDLKSRIVKVCEAKYSFAPSKKNIILLEASGDENIFCFGLSAAGGIHTPNTGLMAGI